MNTSKSIVVLDGGTMNPGDLSWDELKSLGQVTIYDATPAEAIASRLAQAHIAVVNKCVMTSEILHSLPQLKHICVTATGYNNIDIEAAQALGISVSNVSNYSTPAVAQHVFALLLNILNEVHTHHHSIQQGEWQKRNIFSYNIIPVEELAGKKIGILGFGNIGQAVAQVALGFGMDVLTYQRTPKAPMQGCTAVTLDELFEQSDIISLHAPLNKDSKHIINADTLAQMQPTAILINTARGELVDENALAAALQNNTIKAAGLDVLSSEPPANTNPLLGLENCIITPHQAWSSVGARRRLLQGTINNIKNCLAGTPKVVW